jgi:transcriptional regulator with XRE-family HTH domain
MGRTALPSQLAQPLAVQLGVTATEEFASKLLFAYHRTLFDALSWEKPKTIDHVVPLQLGDFSELFPHGELAQARRRRRHQTSDALLGDALRLRRVARGLDQDELRTQIGYSHRSAIANIEAGVAHITPKFFSSWCKILQIREDILASALLHTYEPTLYTLIKGSTTELFSALEMGAIRSFAKHGLKYLGRSIGAEVGSPYRVGDEILVDIVFDMFGRKFVNCVHKSADGYRISNENGEKYHQKYRTSMT